MNHHLNDGQLRAALDDELNAASLRHLETCPLCSRRMEALRAANLDIVNRLNFLAETSGKPGLDSRIAYQHLNIEIKNRKEKSMLKRMVASQSLRIGLAILLVLAVIFSVPSTRALAEKFLTLFRVQQVVVVPVDFSGIQQLTGNNTLGTQVSALISSSVTSDKKPGNPVNVTDAAQASQMTGFDVRVPASNTPSRLTVEGSAAFTLKIDVAKAQALLNEAGRPDLVLPASIDGKNVSVNIPASVSVGFGTCPDPTEPSNGTGIGNGSAGRNFPDCTILVEIPNPTVTAPPELDIAQLAQIGLEFTGMTSAQASAFTKSVDWTSTLVIPLPKNGATYDQVSVDGVTGTLIQRPADDAPQYALIWVKNGIIYAISSLGTNSQQALQIANSLH